MYSNISFTEEYEDRVLFPVPITNVIAPALSSVANIIVVIACILTKSYRTPLEKMVFAVNFTDILYDISRVSGLIHTPSSDPYCKIFESVAKFGVLSSITWSALFGHALLLVAKFHDERILSKVMNYYTFLAVVPPLGLAIASIFSNYAQYSPTLQACVHRVHLGETNWSFFIFLGIPLFITCTASVVFFLMAAVKMRKLLGNQDKCQLWTLAVYPCILLVCWTPILVSQIFAALGRAPAKPVTMALHALDQLQGFFDALVFGGSRNVIRRKCGKVCAKRNRKTSSASSSESLLSLGSNSIIIRKIPTTNSFHAQNKGLHNPVHKGTPDSMQKSVVLL